LWCDNILNALIVNQNNIVRICLNKCTFKRSTNDNYKELGVLPVGYLYKKNVMYLVKNLNLDKHYYKNLGNIRKFRNYVFTIISNMPINRFVGLVDYLAPTSMQ